MMRRQSITVLTKENSMRALLTIAVLALGLNAFAAEHKKHEHAAPASTATVATAPAAPAEVAPAADVAAPEADKCAHLKGKKLAKCKKAAK
jgi:hypothetical protein